jgi:hypothetical protein
MRTTLLLGIISLAAASAGCSGDKAPGGPKPGDNPVPADAAAPTTGEPGTGGMGGGAPDADSTPPPPSGTTPDAGPGSAPDAPAFSGDSGTPMSTDGGPAPSYNGEIPIYYGPEVGPKVEMNCPEDPTAGWTEYKESFHVEHPYTIPTNTRFSITNGIYNFWVFPGDSPHSPNAKGRNPRTEANYGGLHDKMAGAPGADGNGKFTSGQRLYSADMLIEGNAVGSAIMQIHTGATGGGPIGIRINGGNMVNNGSLTVVQGSTVPGGLVDKWFNYKASLNADTLEVKIYINNCLKSTYKGGGGDGHFYFKNGVYFCKTSAKGCFSHYKNIHLYYK